MIFYYWKFILHSKIYNIIFPLKKKDIKPSNILLKSVTAYITDFGLAKIEDEPLKSEMLSVKGTKCYFSPLLFKAKMKGASICIHNPEKSEIFSLGLTIL